MHRLETTFKPLFKRARRWILCTSVIALVIPNIDVRGSDPYLLHREFPQIPPFVQANVGGKIELFLLDTGSGLTATDSAKTNLFGRELTAKESAEYGLPNLQLRQGIAYELGTLSLRTLPVLITDLSSVRLATGFDVVGVIGCISLDDHFIEWDPGTKTLKISRGAFQPMEKMRQTPVTYVNGKPYIKIDLAGESLEVLIDTGATPALHLSPDKFDALVATKQINLESDAMVGTVRGVQGARSGQFLSGELFGVPLKGLTVASQYRSNLVGMDLLQRFHWALDLSKMTFYHGSSHPVPHRHREIGAAILFRDGQIELMEVTEGKLFWNAGLRSKDKILKFGTLEKGNMNIESLYREVAAKAGKEADLRVLRDGQTTPFTVHLPIPPPSTDE